MSNLAALWLLSLMKLRTLLREPEAVFWVFVFPLLLAGGLGLAFRVSTPVAPRVGVRDHPDAEAIRDQLRAGGARAETLDSVSAHEGLRTGRLAVVIEPGDTIVYWLDPVRTEAQAAELMVDRILEDADGRLNAVRRREMTEKGSRYIDFLIPGLLGMNLMGTGIWGVGFAIVQSRSKRLLQRLMSTPMRRWHYLFAQMLGRLLFLPLEVGILVAFAVVIFDVPIRGSIMALGAVSLLGALTFGAVGLLTGSRARTVEGVSGLMNVVMMPMWILSGIFFSTSRFPDVMQPVVQALPLTALNDALRSIMLDGSTLVTVGPELGILVVWGMGTFTVALAVFRWR